MDYSTRPKRCLLYCHIMNSLFYEDPRIMMDREPPGRKRVEVQHGKARLLSK